MMRNNERPWPDSRRIACLMIPQLSQRVLPMPNSLQPYPRHREENLVAPVRCSRTVTYFQAPPFSGTAVVGDAGTFRSMDDVVTPGFESLRASGAILNSPCSRINDTITRLHKPINRTAANGIPQPRDPVAAFWSAAPLPVPPCDPALYSVDTERLVRLATTQALGGIAPPDATSLLTLGEFAETVALLRNPVEAITTGFRRLTRLKREYWRLKALGLTAETIASQYLAVMFGMQPLIADLAMFRDLLSRYVPPRRTSRGKAQDVLRRTETLPYTLPYGQPFSGTTTLTGTCTVEVKAGSFYEYTHHDDVAAIFGTRVSDVPIALWQLTQFSFLVDWALNVGSLIRAFTPVVGVRRLAEWYTIKAITEETIKLSPLTHFTDSVWIGTGGGDSVTRVVETYSRHPCNLGEHAGLAWNIKWSPTKTLLSLSLLTQAVAGYVKAGRNLPIPQLRP